jgi:hypothetical protein
MRITIIYDAAQTIWLTIQRLADGFYRASGAETFSSGPAFAAKKITLTEGTAENVGSYTVDVDPSAWNDGLYTLRVHSNATGNPTLAANTIAIKNGGEVQIGEQDNSNAVYHASIDMNKDGAADEYTVVWFRSGVPVLTGITSPTLTVSKHTDGSIIINGVAMTNNIGILKYDTTASGEKQVVGEGYFIKANATIDGYARTFGMNISRDN